jgi:ribosomal protein S18 acetylase RimI-like enzyme
VADSQGRLAGSIMGAYDGRRGWIGRLCIQPGTRRAGLATRLVREVEKRLAVRGCDKVNLLIEPGNRAVISFYQRLGYAVDDLVFMERWLPAADDLPGY